MQYADTVDTIWHESDNFLPRTGLPFTWKDPIKFIPEPAEVLDFAKGIASLQATNLLKYKMKGGSWIAIRPSGTEPKLKMYCSLVEKDEAAAKAKFAAIREKFEQMFAL